jgi:hypothetical protein
MALPTFENTLLALEPIRRMVPTTITKITQHHRIFGDILTTLIIPKVL